MSWLRIELTTDEQRIVLDERESHPCACVRRRRRALWLPHCGTKREPVAKILGVAYGTVQREVSASGSVELEALRKSGRESPPTSEFRRD